MAGSELAKSAGLAFGRMSAWDHSMALVENRNFFIFQGTSWRDSEIIKVMYSWAKQYVSFKGDKTK